MEYKLNRAWAEINLDNIAHNVIMGVVKADAYGHGVMGITDTLLGNGVTWLAVFMLDEAIQLRKLGIEVPILVLGYTDPARAEEIISYNVTQTVFRYDLARALSDAAVKLRRSVKIHIKIDTGMTSVGFMHGYSAMKNVAEISRLPGIIIEGLFTHFASADEKDKSYTLMQFERFMSICSELSRIGIHIPVKHVCNSAAILEFLEMHLDMVRPGIMIYGMYPSEDVEKSRIDLKPAMTLKAKIIFVKDVEKDICISYGRTFTTKRESKIATISIGYADGYSRLLSNKGKVLVNGELVPIVGKICMDQCMIDITDLKNEAVVGDEAVLFGRQGDREIRVEELALNIGTVNYEVVCSIGKRIPRVYLKDGKICSVLNCL